MKTKPRKDSKLLHCKIESDIADALSEFCAETRMSKTATVERAVQQYLAKYKETGKI